MADGMNFIAVGATSGGDRRVVVCFDGSVTVHLHEGATRKLADDLLRNANYQWPIEEKDDERQD